MTLRELINQVTNNNPKDAIELDYEIELVTVDDKNPLIDSNIKIVPNENKIYIQELV